MCTFASMKRLTATISNWLRRFSYWKEHGDAIKPLYEGTTECKHCGTVFEGNFCPRCGQSRTVSKVTKHGFVMAFLEAYPQLAGTYLRTMWELLFRPGYMIRDYFRGHRVLYAGPFKTFIVTVSIFALFTQVIKPQFAKETETWDSLESKMSSQKRSGDEVMMYFLQSLQNKDKQLESNEWIAPVWKMFKDKANDASTLYLVVLVPVFALFSKIAFRKKLFDGRKLIYAEHFMVFAYLYCIDLFYTVLAVMMGMDETEEYSLLATPFYFVWVYKAIYGLKWKEMVKPIFLYGLLILLALVLLCIATILWFIWIDSSYTKR